jgi:hypothetical protein
MLDILSLIPGKKTHTTGGWYSFNAPCCHHRGHRADTRKRGGIILNGESWSYSCFNCGFKAGSSPGKHFSTNTKNLLVWAGHDPAQVDRWSFENFGARSLYELMRQPTKPVIKSFDKRTLPEDSEPLDSTLPAHKKYTDYLLNRGLSPTDYQYYVTPTELGRDADRIIVPYMYQGSLVGYTSRYLDGRVPKYVSDQQRGYVFNLDAQHSDWTYCIVVEGQFDAISIGGCAIMSNQILDEAAQLLGKLNRTIIVVPDRDKAGLTICERALELGYKVSIPNWHPEIKDTNDAVARYGRVPTLLSILEAATSSKILIEMKKRKINE